MDERQISPFPLSSRACRSKGLNPGKNSVSRNENPTSLTQHRVSPMDNLFVDLDRKFRSLSDDQADTVDLELGWDWGWHHRETWSEIENRFRTVILAEAGSGKTRETNQRCQVLKSLNKTAFFLPLEILENDGFSSMLEGAKEKKAFGKWLLSPNEHAWFYLDSVDELKLREGSFQRALKKLKDAIRSAEHRSHIIITCRPNDWYKSDEQALLKFFPSPVPVLNQPSEQFESSKKNHATLSSERFLSPLRGNPSLTPNFSQATSSQLPEGHSPAEKFAVFKLLPLQDSQIEKFIRASSITNPELLISEIRGKDAWNFARTPQDINELISLWEERADLGSKTEQCEAHIRNRLRDRPDRLSARQQLSESLAREGVERLSLALTLCKKRTIRIPGATGARANADGTIDAEQVLHNWRPLDVKTLLGLGIFDPPTFGRVRFHRRGVEGYLAAHRLNEIARKGNASKRHLLERLFARTASGEKIVIPSMESIACWIASWNQDVRRILIEVAPELLIAEGDPEHLPVEDRRRIIAGIICQYKVINPKIYHFSPANLRRFCDPNLADIISTMWHEAIKFPNAIRFLITLVKEGSFKGFSVRLNDVVRDIQCENATRALAIQALISTRSETDVRAIVSDILNSREYLPTEITQQLTSELFPDYLSARQLVHIIKTSISPGGSPEYVFEASLSAIVKKIDANSRFAVDLRNELVSLVLENQRPSSSYYRPTSHYSFAALLLARICSRQAPIDSDSHRQSFLKACFTAEMFGKEHDRMGHDLRELNDAFRALGFSKEYIFLSELRFMINELNSSKGMNFIVRFNTFIPCLEITDWTWLSRIAKDNEEDKRIRSTALLDLIRLWRSKGRRQALKQQLRLVASGDPELEFLLESHLKPQRYLGDSDARNWKRDQKQEEERRLSDWLIWRAALLAEPDEYFSKDRIDDTRQTIIEWMQADSKSYSSYQVWAKGTGVSAAFGKEVKQRMRIALSSFWRDVQYLPFSSRADNDTKIYYSWIHGLNGVLAEAEERNWASKLSTSDVEKATLLSLVEINRIPAFVTDLATQHFTVVSRILGAELASQLNLANQFQYLPLLQHLTHADRVVQSAVVQPLKDFISNWKDGEKEVNEAHKLYHLSQVLRLLTTIVDDLEVDALKNICLEKFLNHPSSPAAVYWLRTLFGISAEEASCAAKEAIDSIADESLRRRIFTLWLGTVFEPYEGVEMKVHDEQQRAAVLARLCRMAYRYVALNEDIKHTSGKSYSPVLRDHAQTARARLLNQLIELPGEGAHAAIMELMEEPIFNDVKEYLRGQIKIREVESTEPHPLPVNLLKELEAEFECLPVNRDSFFTLVSNRLADIQHDISHHDFFPRRTIQGIFDEDEMQRILSLILEEKGNLVYSVVREDESADAKRTDIRLLSCLTADRAVIEVKIAEKWSMKDFIRALEFQLLGQYLRHATCKSGFLLLTYRGPKTWKHPQTMKRLEFSDVITELSLHASELEKKAERSVKLGIIGLDLRNPLLVPAHG